MRRVLACSLPLLLFACQSQTTPDAADPQKAGKKVPKPIYIGTIYQVYPAHNFALVRLARDVPKVGVTLISHPADGSNLRLGNLCVSAEKVDNTVSRMIAADIRSGTVMRGDAVYIYMDLTAQAPRTQADPAATPADAPAPAATPAPVGAGASPLASPDATTPSPSATPTPPWMADGAASVSPTPAAPTTPAASPATPSNSGSAPVRSPGAGSPDPDLPDFIKKIPDTVDGWENI